MATSGVSPVERRRSSFVVRAGCAGDGVLRGRTKPAVFLDRDGVLNEEGGYVAKRRDFHWMPEAERAVRAMVRDGFRVLVVTNQGAVGAGLDAGGDCGVCSGGGWRSRCRFRGCITVRTPMRRGVRG